MALNQDAFDAARDAYSDRYDGFGSADKALEAAIEAYLADVSRAPAAAETAEREAERRYPAFAIFGMPDGVPVTERNAFVEGVAWQRDQSALSGELLATIKKHGPSIALYDRVHEELDDKTWAQIDHDLKLSYDTYGAWKAYMRQRLVNGLRDIVRTASTTADRSAPSGTEPLDPDIYNDYLQRMAEIGPQIEQDMRDNATRVAEIAFKPLFGSAAPSPAPEQQAETTAFQAYWAATHTLACCPDNTPDDTLVNIPCGTLRLAVAELKRSALPHPAPAADTVAVPREMLSRVEQWFRVGSSPEERDFSIEITRLMGETP